MSEQQGNILRADGRVDSCGDVEPAGARTQIHCPDGLFHFISDGKRWRETDSDGWIAHAGKGVPDFGLCERVEIEMRSGVRDTRSPMSIIEAASFPGSTWMWATNGEGVPVEPWCNDDKIAWRPAASSPSQGLTPEAVRGVLRGEQPKAEPQWTAPITREVGNHPGSVNGRVQYRIKGNVEWIDASSDYIARYLPSTWDRDAKNYAPLELRFLQSEWDKVHLASAPKAEEPAKEEAKPDPVAPLSEWMQSLGMLSPYAPSMVVDTLDPVGMARQIMAAIEAQLPPKPPRSIAVADQALILTPMDGRAGSWRP